jgi:cbb3-type cytochrome oxidase maturation protein
MDSLYLLIPLSIVLVLLIGGLLAWAVLSGQFENLDDEAARILDEKAPPPPRE